MIADTLAAAEREFQEVASLLKEGDFAAGSNSQAL